MKSIVFLFLSFAVLGLHAQEAKNIYCESIESVNRRSGVDYKEVLKLTGTLNANNEFTQVQTSGMLKSSVLNLKVISAGTNNFADYNKYSTMADAWCFFNPMLPKNVLNSQEANFATVVEMKCESGSHQFIKMKCQKN